MTRIRQGPAIVCIERYARPHQYSHFHNTIDSSSLKNKTRLEQNTIISQKSQDEKKNLKKQLQKAGRTDSFIIIDCVKLLNLSWEGGRRRRHNNTHIWTSDDWFYALVVDLPYARGRPTIDSPLSLPTCRMLADAWRLILRSRCRFAVCSRRPSEENAPKKIGNPAKRRFHTNPSYTARREWANQNPPPTH